MASHLDHGVPLHVVLESLELEVQHGRERLEDDSLPRVLESVALGVVLVLSVHCLDRDVVLKRVVKVLHSLDVELDVFEEEVEEEVRMRKTKATGDATNRSSSRSEQTRSRR